MRPRADAGAAYGLITTCAFKLECEAVLFISFCREIFEAILVNSLEFSCSFSSICIYLTGRSLLTDYFMFNMFFLEFVFVSCLGSDNSRRFFFSMVACLSCSLGPFERSKLLFLGTVAPRTRLLLARPRCSRIYSTFSLYCFRCP